MWPRAWYEARGVVLDERPGAEAPSSLTLGFRGMNAPGPSDSSRFVLRAKADPP